MRGRQPFHPVAGCWQQGHWRKRLQKALRYVNRACRSKGAKRPELVRRDEVKDDPPNDDPALRGLYLAEDMKQRTDHGAVGYPERATAEKGRALLNAAVARTVEVVQALLGRPLPS